MWQVGDKISFQGCSFVVTVIERIDEHRFMTTSDRGPMAYSDGPNDPGGFILIEPKPAPGYLELFL